MSAQAHTTRAHARLSPSSAHRFIACPGSVPMSSHVKDESGPAANEGTAAHELAAWVLEDEKRSPGDMLGRVIDIQGDSTALRFLKAGAPVDGNFRWPVTDEMVEAVGIFVDHVRSLPGELEVETRLDISHVHPEIFGTGDVIVYDEAEKKVTIVDLKYGRGVVVEAEDNPQLTLYASGAAKRYHNRGVKTVTATIVQPRAPHPSGPIRSETFDFKELSARERKMSSAAAMVDEAMAQVSQMEHGAWMAAYLTPGDHCRFCPVGATCQARAKQALVDAKAEFSDDGEMVLPDPMSVSPEDLADLLTRARQIQHWIKAVEEYAHAEATAGRVPPGFKMVPTRAIRKWKDEDGLIAAAPVMFSIGADDLYAPPKLLSPAQLEKKIPKDERAMLDSFITKSSSGTNLVPEDDARAPARGNAADEFAD